MADVRGRPEPEWVEHDWVEHDGLIELMPWGRSTYTILRLPATLETATRAARTRRVEGAIEDIAVNVGLNRADVLPDAFAYVGAALQRRVGARPGDVVRCRLRPADPDQVPLTDDVERALDRAGRRAVFEQRSPAQRRRLLQPVDDAARPETRLRRIDALVRALGPG